jgi:hypothetical protein
MGKNNSREPSFTTETRGYREKPDKNVLRFLRLMITVGCMQLFAVAWVLIRQEF